LSFIYKAYGVIMRKINLLTTMIVLLFSNLLLSQENFSNNSITYQGQTYNLNELEEISSQELDSITTPIEILDVSETVNYAVVIIDGKMYIYNL